MAEGYAAPEILLNPKQIEVAAITELDEYDVELKSSDDSGFREHRKKKVVTAICTERMREMSKRPLMSFIVFVSIRCATRIRMARSWPKTKLRPPK